MEKTCNVCGETKPLDEFYKHGRTPDGHRYVCKECVRARSRAWQAANKDRGAARQRAWVKANPERRRDIKLRSTYGLSLPEYKELLEAQANGCAICGRTAAEEGRRLAVDHDHEVGQVRGLLCTRCNQGLGHFMHDPKLLQAAIAYMERWSEQEA